MNVRWGPVHRLLRRFGVDVVRHPGASTTLGRRLGHFRTWGIDLVVDVGANTGQYAQALRSMGFRGEIVSIEPLPDAWEILNQRCARDPRWRCLQLAIGKSDARATLYVAENSYSSSFYPTTNAHVQAAPAARAVGSVDVEVRRLEELADDLVRDATKPLLKLDTQGSELEILEGAGAALDRFAAAHVELSLVPMYADTPEIWTVVGWLEQRGFVLAELEPEFSDPVSGRLLQVNGLFMNERVAAK